MAFLAPLAGVAAASSGATAVGLGVAGVGLGLVGTGISAYGMIKQGKQAKAEANAAADEMETNAVVAQYNARRAIEDSRREAARLRDIRIRNIGAQIADVGHSGITQSGSALHVMRDTAIAVEKDIEMARYRGETEAYNYGAEAKSLLTQSGYARSSGAFAKRSANLSAFGTALSGVSNAGLGYYNIYSRSHG